MGLPTCACFTEAEEPTRPSELLGWEDARGLLFGRLSRVEHVTFGRRKGSVDVGLVGRPQLRDITSYHPAGMSPTQVTHW